jgi:peptide/nickel transport system permease protein
MTPFAPFSHTETPMATASDVRTDIPTPHTEESAPPPAQVPEAARRRRSLWARLSLPGRIAAIVIVLAVLIALLAPLISPADPDAGVTSARLGAFGQGGHLLGTDGQGRDLLSRMIWGARPSLLTGLVPVLIATLVGTAIGIAAGLAGRLGNTLTMRVLDVFYAFPAILLAIAIATVLGSGSSNSIIALAVILIPPLARLAEGETARLRGLDFMEAATASGARRSTIAVRHVLPNVGPPILVYATALIGLSIVYAAGLSFLGLGIQPPTAEWGLMVSDLRQYIFSNPGLALVPAIAILVVSVAFNLLGDALRDAIDVKLGTQS